MTPRTSQDDPLRIASIPVGAGMLGVTLCPGKQGDSVFGAAWQRDLDVDLDAIQAWGAAAVVTLVESAEMAMLGVPDLGDKVRQRGLRWHHLPIRDMHAPDAKFEAAWPAVVADLCELLRTGGRVLVHCRGGLGRAGTVAACLLVEHGIAPHDAIRQVRAARPHAIETREQERYVLAHRPVAGDHAR